MQHAHKVSKSPFETVGNNSAQCMIKSWAGKRVIIARGVAAKSFHDVSWLIGFECVAYVFEIYSFFWNKDGKCKIYEFMSKCVHYVFFARKNEYIMQRKSKNLLIENKFDIVSQLTFPNFP